MRYRQRHQTHVSKPYLAALGILLSGLSLGAAVGAGHQQLQPTGQAENVRIEAANGAVTIRYDLTTDDLRAVFSIAVEVSKDGGKTFDVRPLSVSGDVGPNVRAGLGKRIEWDIAKDLPGASADQLRARINVVGAMIAAPAARPTGVLVVSTDPSGATVTVDGQQRGVSPLTIADLQPGVHRIVIGKPGYLENSSEIDVAPGGPTNFQKSLTSAQGSQTATAAPPRQAPPSGPTPAPAGGGGWGHTAKWAIPVAAGGGAAAFFLLKKSATPCTSSISPTGFSPGSGGGSIQVAVSLSPSGCSPATWTASGSNIASVNPTSGTGNGAVTVSVSPNPGINDQSGTVTIAGQAFSINQSGLACTYVFSANDADNGNPFTTVTPTWTIPAGAPTGRTVGVGTSNSLCTWSTSGDSWIIATPSSGTGNVGTNVSRGPGVVLTFQRNTTGQTRTGRITFSGTAPHISGTPSFTFSVTQSR